MKVTVAADGQTLQTLRSVAIQGTKDPLTPYEQTVHLHEGLNRVSVGNQLLTVPGGGHGGGSFSRSDRILVQSAVFKFLRQHGVLEEVSERQR